MAKSFEVASVFTAVDKFSNPLGRMSSASSAFSKKVQGSTARASRALDSINKPINSLTSGFKNLVGVAGGFAIGAGLLHAATVVAEFEQASVDLGAILGKSTSEMKALDDNAKLLGATTSFTATEVLKLEEAYARLGFKQADIISLTAGTIDGAVALGATAEEAAGLAGALVNTFDDFKASDTPEIFDKLTLATQNSALNFEKLQVALPIVGGAANAAGVPFDKLVALLGKLSDAGIDTSSSATALRNIFIDSKSEGKDFADILKSISKNQDKLTAANDAFGKKTAVSAAVLSNQIAKTQTLNDIITSATAGQERAGVASEVAEKKLDTLQGRLTLLSSAYTGFLLSNEDGSGGLARFAKNTTEVITEMFALAGGFAQATESLNAHELKVRSTAETLVFFVKWTTLAFVAVKVLTVGIWVVRKALIAWNIIQGISNALQGKSVFALRANRVATIASMLTTKAITIATWAWSAAMSGFLIITKAASVASAALNAIMLANPIGLIIIAVVALGVAIAIMINKWDEWGQVANLALMFLMPPLGIIIGLVMTLRKNWEMISNAFSQGGMIEGIKAIGIAIFDMILSPVQRLLEMLSSIPGLMDVSATAAADIKAFRAELGLDVGGSAADTSAASLSADSSEVGAAAINSRATEIQTETSTSESRTLKEFLLNITNNTGFDVSLESESDLSPIRLTSTLSE